MSLELREVTKEDSAHGFAHWRFHEEQRSYVAGERPSPIAQAHFEPERGIFGAIYLKGQGHRFRSVGENAEDAGHGHPMALYDRPKNTKLEGMAGVPLALAFYTDENPVGFVMVETRYPSAEGPSGCEPSCHFK